MNMNKNVLRAALAGVVILASTGIVLAAPAVASANVNVRSGPGSGYGVVAVLRRGEAVEVTGCRSTWCYVERRGPDGWVSSHYLNGRSQATRPSINFSFSFGNMPTAPRPPRPGNHGGPGHHGGHGGWNGGNDWPDDGWNQNQNDGPWWRD